MRPKDNIHKLIKKLQLRASADLDRRVHDDISKALAESEKHALSEVEGTESAVRQNIWRSITKGGATKLAVAASIFIAFGIGLFIGRWSKPAQLVPHSLDVTGYTSAISVYTTVSKVKDSFWRRKAIAAMQPRPYTQIQFNKTGLLNAYKQYLKEKHYE